MILLCILLAALSVWDYPARFPSHVALRRQFLAAIRSGDAATMESTCRKGTSLLPEDPTWRYNLACSLARFPNRASEALDELEKAIDLGFRDRDAIARDADLKRLSGQMRYLQLLEYADMMKTRPLLFGPLAAVEATGTLGHSVMLGEQNLGWDFDAASFVAKMKLTGEASGGNAGDLYMNRDNGHSPLKAEDFPGITSVRLDAEGRRRGMDLDFPNMLFPYPVFGNVSRAFTRGPYWRSISRSLVTTESIQIAKMARLYLSNQTWVFVANADIPPVGTNGDVFASITPYWLTTAGASYLDMPYVRAALEASRSLPPRVKANVLERKLLAPTIQVLIRKSLHGVMNEVDYLTPRAHPTALPIGGLDLDRLKAAAAAMTEESVPPLATVSVAMPRVKLDTAWPELTYASPHAWAFVLRAERDRREFVLTARGGDEYAFVQTHGTGADVRIERLKPDVAKVTIDRRGLSPTNRVDIGVFARGKQTGWGAPSYVCFARMDPRAPYSDPALTPRSGPVVEKLR